MWLPLQLRSLPPFSAAPSSDAAGAAEPRCCCRWDWPVGERCPTDSACRSYPSHCPTVMMQMQWRAAAAWMEWPTCRSEKVQAQSAQRGTVVECDGWCGCSEATGCSRGQRIQVLVSQRKSQLGCVHGAAGRWTAAAAPSQSGETADKRKKRTSTRRSKTAIARPEATFGFANFCDRRHVLLISTIRSLMRHFPVTSAVIFVVSVLCRE